VWKQFLSVGMIWCREQDIIKIYCGETTCGIVNWVRLDHSKIYWITL